MPKDILFSVLRTAFAYLLLLLVTRIMGRKMIEQMTFFDFAIAITLGSVASDIAEAGNSTLLSTSTALVTFATLGLLTSFIYLKSIKLRKLINSEPLVLIENNQIIEKNMKKLKMTLNDLTSLLREQNAFNIADVNYAIIENDGKLSVLLKGDKKTATPADMNLHPPDEGLCRELIIDGEILEENLKAANLSQDWLYEELKKKEIYKIKDVFFASLDSAGKLYVSKRCRKQEKPGEHGIE